MYGCRLGRRTGRRFGDASQIESFKVNLVLLDNFDNSVIAKNPSLHSTSANAVTRLNNVTTAIPTPATQATTSIAGCPAADGFTYTITNQVAPTARPYKQSQYSSLAYKILCDTDFSAGPTIVDLQALSNTSSLGDCLNACALYSFQTPPWEFPTHICSGVAWESGANMCWLKSNVTLSSQSQYQSSDPTPDGAVMITPD